MIRHKQHRTQFRDSVLVKSFDPSKVKTQRQADEPAHEDIHMTSRYLLLTRSVVIPADENPTRRTTSSQICCAAPGRPSAFAARDISASFFDPSNCSNR